MPSVANEMGTESFQKIEVNRHNCLVEYHPPRPGHKFSTLDLTPKSGLSETVIEQLVRKEIQTWTEKYRYPFMLTVFSTSDDIMPQKWLGDASHVLVWLDGTSGELRIGNMNHTTEFDESVRNLYPQRLKIFAGLPFSTHSERSAALASKIKEQQLGMRVFKLALFLWVAAIPAIWIIATSFGPNWLALLATFYSLFQVYRECSKIFGWRSESSKEKAKEEEEALMKHHHYHCLKNPTAFNQLKSENLRKEIEDANNAKFAAPK